MEEVARTFDGKDANVGVAAVEEVKADLAVGQGAAHIEEILPQKD